MKKAWAWIRWVLVALGTAIMVLAGRKFIRVIFAEVGPTVSKDNFTRVPDDPQVLLVSKKEKPEEQIEVVLPPGIRSDQVKAVEIVQTGRAFVEILP